MKNKFAISALLILFIVVLAIANPSTADYENFSVDVYGEIPQTNDLEVKIDRNNYLLFSTFTPIAAKERGFTHLGIMGNFFKITDGQF